MKQIITIWSNKNDPLDWLRKAVREDCRNKEGYEKVGYIGYNIKTVGAYTTFASDNCWGGTNDTMVLTINIDSIENAVDK